MRLANKDLEDVPTKVREGGEQMIERAIKQGAE
jgi:hypothetical protein